MKKTIYIFILLILFFTNIYSIFETGRKVYCIKTKYFDILYGEN